MSEYDEEFAIIDAELNRLEYLQKSFSDSLLELRTSFGILRMLKNEEEKGQNNKQGNG